MRLTFVSSFTEDDALEIELETGNFDGFADVTGTTEGELAFAEGEGNDLSVAALLYAFPIGESTEVVLAANGVGADDFVDTVNFLDGNGGFGALSACGTRNPIYYLVDVRVWLSGKN